MPSRSKHALGRGHLASVVAVLAVLAGLVGMHVLGLHGVQHETVPALSAVAGHDHSAAGHDHAATAAEHASVAAGAVAAEPCCDHGHDMDALMLCLALLVASTVLVVLASSRARSDLIAWPAVSPGAFRVSWRARAGPPLVMAFSVVRC